MARAQFEMSKDSRGRFGLRLRAPNGEITSWSEPQESKDACEKGIAWVERNAAKATVNNLTG